MPFLFLNIIVEIFTTVLDIRRIAEGQFFVQQRQFRFSAPIGCAVAVAQFTVDKIRRQRRFNPILLELPREKTFGDTTTAGLMPKRILQIEG